MSRRSERRRRAALAGCVLSAAVSAAGDARAQAAPRDTTPRPRPTAPRDSARPGASTLDTVGTASPLRDGRRAAADSTARDSAVARQRRESARVGRVRAIGALVDRLQLTTIGATAGAAWPRRVESAMLYAVHADYGELVSGVGVVFGVSYWTSRYTAGAQRGLADAVAGVVRDPTGDARVDIPRIRASALSFSVDGRWHPPIFSAWRAGPSARFRPFVGAGLAVHFPNTEGAPLTGTFAEQTLDGVALGLAGSTGFELAVLPNFQLTMHARYDLFNGTHFPSLRAGAGYVFEPWGARAPAGGAR